MKNVLSLINKSTNKFKKNKSIIYRDNIITYENLSHLSSLISLKISTTFKEKLNRPIYKNDIIAICVEKDADLLPIIIGILKSGAAYLPIDTQTPIYRMKGIINDSNAKFLIIKSDLLGKIQDLNLDIHLMDQEDLFFEEGKAHYKESYIQKDLSIIDENALAYVIYTSGSTGKPKAVGATHKNLYNLVRAQMEYFKINTAHKVLCFSNISFDASVWEYFVTLASGATLILADKNETLPGTHLEETINKYKITHLTLPPSALNVTSPEDLNSLEVVISAGEKLNTEILKKWVNKKFLFFNAYGPTECTVCSSIIQCHPNISPSNIGKNFAGSKLHLFSEKMEQILSPNTKGELYIGGPVVSAGYIRNEILHSNYFVKNPLNFDEILYKTGDIVHLDLKGDYHFLGRIDNQIKLRGFRIELEEIEQNLNLIDGVISSVVLNFNNNLYAFIQENNSHTLSEHFLTQSLSSKLPYYMIPSRFIFLKELPQTLNNKINREALLEKLKEHPEIDMVNNLNPIEEEVIKIIRNILDINSVSINDNFFKIGGHSLLMTRVILEIKKKLGVNISISQFINVPTLKKLAGLISSIRC